ncbi:carboxypeptidase-like regulatory domain-containing protein [Ekhidna sp.]|uniref:carboxypeptidase-like regulatory domain-containing protein n=1 Tax=Ekhidna sp. TaxID=2608089 RepID=UPI003CCC03AC
MKYLLSIKLFFLMLMTSFSQRVVDGILLDASNSEPVAYAHVILADSSHGTFTNYDGKFQLIVDQIPTGIIISHVNYVRHETKIGNEVRLRVNLKPIENQLEDIEIESKVDKKWRREYKIFRQELFGLNPLSEDCKILNPWVIDFERSNGFTATSDELLEISNEALGYIVQFRLDGFQKKGGKVSLKGEPADIKDLSEDEENLEYFNQGRYAAYKGSIFHFIASLSAGELPQNGFQAYLIGENYYDIRGESNRRIQQAAILELKEITSFNNPELIDFRGFLQVIYTDPISREVEISWLQCSEPFSLDQNGYLIDTGQLVQYGHFASERLSHYPIQNLVGYFEN